MGFKVCVTRFVEERMSSTKIQQGRCFDKSEPATEGKSQRFAQLQGLSLEPDHNADQTKLDKDQFLEQQ